MCPKESYFTAVNFVLNSCNVVHRVKFVNVLRYWGMFYAHPFVGVAYPVVLGSSNSPVGDFRREETPTVAESTLPHWVRAGGPDRVCKEFGLHVFDVLRETVDVFVIIVVGFFDSVGHFENLLVGIRTVNVSGLDFEDPEAL